jgi:hypothetical protein
LSYKTSSAKKFDQPKDNIRINFDCSEIQLLGDKASLMRMAIQQYFILLKHYKFPNFWQRKFEMIEKPDKMFKFELDAESQEYIKIKNNTLTG